MFGLVFFCIVVFVWCVGFCLSLRGDGGFGGVVGCDECVIWVF